MATWHRQPRRRRRTHPPPLNHHRPNVIQPIDTAGVLPPGGDMTIKGRQRGRLNCCVSLHIDCPGGGRITASSIVPRSSPNRLPHIYDVRGHTIAAAMLYPGITPAIQAKSDNEVTSTSSGLHHGCGVRCRSDPVPQSISPGAAMSEIRQGAVTPRGQYVTCSRTRFRRHDFGGSFLLPALPGSSCRS
jgi:hypothetical protein